VCDSVETFLWLLADYSLLLSLVLLVSYVEKSEARLRVAEHIALVKYLLTSWCPTANLNRTTRDVSSDKRWVTIITRTGWCVTTDSRRSACRRWGLLNFWILKRKIQNHTQSGGIEINVAYTDVLVSDACVLPTLEHWSSVAHKVLLAIEHLLRQRPDIGTVCRLI